MAKKYLKMNVYEAANARVEYLFKEFDNVFVAFSGGKDSAVCLNICYDYAAEHGCLDRLAFYHLDYEAQYQATTDFVTETFARFSDIKRKWWVCLPVGASCCCNMEGGTWVPWERAKKDLWVRKMPGYDYVVNEDNCPWSYYVGEKDYDVQDRIGEWFEREYGKTALVIGVRTDESMNRFRAVASERTEKYKGKIWINSNGVAKAYPIYDWQVGDIWRYNSKFNKPYNRLYDLYFMAGLKPGEMRVASPFHDCGQATLHLYKVIDPNNWGRMVGRVNGVNFTGLYGGTTAMGWKNITKPKHFTWKEYCQFLLNTLPPKAKAHYTERLEKSMKVWRTQGGALDDTTITELRAEGAEFRELPPGKRSTKRVIAVDDYFDDTSVTDFKSIPTYKRMCICIMKNDWFCKYMGFAPTTKEIERRKAALEKYKNL